jgi:hypothetical protein
VRPFVIGLIGFIGLAAVPALPALASADVTVRVLPPEATKGFEQDHISKAALAGEEIRVWGAQMLEPDCTAHGTMQTDIMEQPKHGKARVSDEPFFGGFPPNNVRYHCNTQKSPGKQVFYVAEAGYHGHDKLLFQNSTTEGRIRKWVVDIDVRPPAAP